MTDLREQFSGSRQTFVPVRVPAAGFHRLSDDARDAPARIERGIRILEHHLHAPARRSRLRREGTAQILAIEQDAAGVGCSKPDQKFRNRALAAAALADQGDELVFGNMERRTFTAVTLCAQAQKAAADRIVFFQPFHLQHVTRSDVWIAAAWRSVAAMLGVAAARRQATGGRRQSAILGGSLRRHSSAARDSAARNGNRACRQAGADSASDPA